MSPLMIFNCVTFFSFQEHKDKDLIFTDGYQQIKKSGISGDDAVSSSLHNAKLIDSDILNDENPVDVPEIELQTFDDAVRPDEEHWLVRGVKRIRRGLDQFMGKTPASTDDATAVKQQKRKHKKASHNTEGLVDKQYKSKLNKSKNLEKSIISKNRNSHLNSITNNVRSKRQHE